VNDAFSWTAGGVGEGVGAFDKFFAEEVLARFPSPELVRRSDAARLDLGSLMLAITCDGYTVDPLFFPGGDVGTLAVCGTANDLLTEGARPEWLLMCLVLGDGIDQDIVRRVLDSVQEQASRSGASLVGGDTKTIKSLGPGLIVTMTGLGRIRRQGPTLGFELVRAGDELVVTGPVGAHSVAVLSAREGLGFEQVVSSDCRDVGLSIGPLVMSSPAIRALRDATRGGLLGVLHELASSTGLAVELDADAVPVAREVAMAAEMLGLDPLELTNEGCFVIVVEAGTSRRLAGELRNAYGFHEAAVVGEIREPADPLARVMLRRGAETRVSVRTLSLGVPRLC
jgi:hydrogenase expression/formation protein HypE